MNRFGRSTLKLGPLLLDLCASGVGCFVFRPGYRLVATEKDRSSAEISICVVGPTLKPQADVGA
jgi:hypothetical protein